MDATAMQQMTRLSSLRTAWRQALTINDSDCFAIASCSVASWLESKSPPAMNADKIQELIPQLYALVVQLEATAPGRSFAPDGHLLGSIGEVIAAARYGLTLTTASTKGIDAHTADGRPVEIKATAGKSIALRGMEPSAELLVVLQISPDGAAAEVYNGLAAPVWAQAGKLQGNGQRRISLKQLQGLQDQAPVEQRLPEVG